MIDHRVVCSMSRSGNVWTMRDGEILLVLKTEANSPQNVPNKG